MASDIGGVWRTVGGRRIFIKDGQLLEDAMKQSGKFNKNKAQGLGANETTHTLEKHPTPKRIGKTNDLSEENVYKILKKYEKQILSEKIENAIVITQDGEIYQCFGNQNTVWPDVDLGDKLYNSYVTHNHTAEETYNGFSSKDNNLFKKYDLKMLRGIDKDYIYEYNTFKLERAAMPSDMEQVYGLEHLRSIQFAANEDIYYNRWENNGK